MSDKKEKSFEEIRDEYFTAAFGDMGKTVSEYLAEISDLACPPFVRGKIIPGYPDFSREEVTTRYTKLKEVVKAFSEKYIQKFKDLSVDWQYLNVHSVLVILFANIYIARYNGDEEKVTYFSSHHIFPEDRYRPNFSCSFFDGSLSIEI